ncbi:MULTISPECIES: hypothetical protein [Caproicibacterium]|uniref:Uncharacterized protein n=1 Tax=Caproicibacterium argilliputei TaxID=3030016 RepID=A0AA97H1F2_9FIRM|nr:hypothetical protein [Caproicibacterium argilliputei]WOC31620.1 hypothetical protein PXC00_10410 [Caproicibacterium argilliputei]
MKIGVINIKKIQIANFMFENSKNISLFSAAAAGGKRQNCAKKGGHAAEKRRVTALKRAMEQTSKFNEHLTQTKHSRRPAGLQ